MTTPKKLEITHITVFIDGDEYCADITINDEFIVQAVGNGLECKFNGIVDSDYCYKAAKQIQDKAAENYNNNDVLLAIEQAGFKNDLGWLTNNADAILR